MAPKENTKFIAITKKCYACATLIQFFSPWYTPVIKMIKSSNP